jgi:hypothetical protein
MPLGFSGAARKLFAWLQNKLFHLHVPTKSGASFAPAIVRAAIALIFIIIRPEIRRARLFLFASVLHTSREWGRASALNGEPHVCDALRAPAYAIFRCNPRAARCLFAAAAFLG